MFVFIEIKESKYSRKFSRFDHEGLIDVKFEILYWFELDENQNLL